MRFPAPDAMRRAHGTIPIAETRRPILYYTYVQSL